MAPKAWCRTVQFIYTGGFGTALHDGGAHGSTCCCNRRTSSQCLCIHEFFFPVLILGFFLESLFSFLGFGSSLGSARRANLLRTYQRTTSTTAACGYCLPYHLMKRPRTLNRVILKLCMSSSVVNLMMHAFREIAEMLSDLAVAAR